MWKLIFPKNVSLKEKAPLIFWEKNKAVMMSKLLAKPWKVGQQKSCKDWEKRWNRFHRIYKDLNTKGKKSNSLGRFFSKNASTKTSSYIFVFDHSVFGDSSSFINQKKQKHLQSLHPCMASAALVHPHSESKTLPVGALNRWASASASKTYSFRDMKRESGSGPDWPWGEVRKSSVVKGKRMVFGEAAAGKAAASQRDA